MCMIIEVLSKAHRVTGYLKIITELTVYFSKYPITQWASPEILYYPVSI